MVVIISGWVFAADQEFVILPRAESSQADLWSLVDAVWWAKTGSQLSWDTVRDRYNQAALQKDGNVWDQLSTGIMTRDTILDAIAYAVRKLSELALLIGWLMIVYAGYQYAMESWWWGNAWDGQKAIINAVYGILVIIFSYAIIKIVSGTFLF